MTKKIILFALSIFLFASFVHASSDSESDEQTVEAAASNTATWKYIAAGLAVGIACIAGGLAVGKVGSAAMGAMAENSELSGKALPFVGLAEGICLWGFIIALLILVLK